MNTRIRTSALSSLICLLTVHFAASQTIWEKDPFSIYLQDNNLEFFHEKTKIMEIQSVAFNFIQPDTILIENVKDDTLNLQLVFNQTDGYHGNFPSQIRLTISHFNNTFHLTASHSTFRHVTIKMKDLNEHYFGCLEKLYPENAKSPDLRGNVVDVEVYGYGERDYAENYASAYSAFYISSLGYGSFFDTFAKGRYHFAVNGTTEIYHQTDALDWYIFYGPTGDIIHREYFNIIGRPKYIPMWACGPIFWRDQNNGGKDELLDDIQKFTELEIPLTACWVDRPYSNGSSNWSLMDFNEKFAEPENWIRTINEQYGLQFMTWVAPLTFSDRDFPGLLPNYKGYLDLTDPDAITELENRLNTYQYAVGVKGHKMDRADENFPFTSTWNERTSESESRNRYVYLYSKVMHDILVKALGDNHFNFARAAFHRCQPYLSALWGGDSRSNWQGRQSGQRHANWIHGLSCMGCGYRGVSGYRPN
ncbi:hypothetical protein JW824_07220 [bacterium]|nr:hypothetical protein [bacterium]